MAPNQTSGGNHAGATNDALYKELWHACAGPLVSLPREGERVYYFPQGHMEQVQAAWTWVLYFELPLQLQRDACATILNLAPARVLNVGV